MPTRRPDAADAQLSAQYEAYPYPVRDPREEAKRLVVGSPSHLREIDHWIFAARRPAARPLRALIAGGGRRGGSGSAAPAGSADAPCRRPRSSRRPCAARSRPWTALPPRTPATCRSPPPTSPSPSLPDPPTTRYGRERGWVPQVLEAGRDAKSCGKRPVTAPATPAARRLLAMKLRLARPDRRPHRRRIAASPSLRRKAEINRSAPAQGRSSAPPSRPNSPRQAPAAGARSPPASASPRSTQFRPPPRASQHLSMAAAPPPAPSSTWRRRATDGRPIRN